MSYQSNESFGDEDQIAAARVKPEQPEDSEAIWDAVHDLRSDNGDNS